MFLKIFLIVCIQINFVINCDDSVSDATDTSAINEEYMNIFRTIPTLFEYVMDVIEEKPEILEKDDITVFTLDSNRMLNDGIAEKVEVIGEDKADLVYNGSEQSVDIDYSSSMETGDTDDSDTVEFEDDGDTGLIKPADAGDSSTTEDTDEYDSGSMDDSEEDDDDEYENQRKPAFGEFWDWFSGAMVRKRIALTATEIAEKALEIEKQLEQHNNNKN